MATNPAANKFPAIKIHPPKNQTCRDFISPFPVIEYGDENGIHL